MQATGIVPDKPCTRCREDRGPFVGCIISPMAGNGACANCHYSSLGFKCNYHVRNMHGTSRLSIKAALQSQPRPMLPSER
jgi:hypothetical protein